MMTFSKHPFMNRQKGKAMIEFIANSATGYVPLLKLVSTIGGGNANHFEVTRNMVKQTVLHEVNLYNTRNVFSFRQHMKESTSVNNPRSTIAISLLSVLGFQGNPEYIMDTGRRQGEGVPNNQMIMVTNRPTVFALAVIKASDVSKIDMSGYEIKIDPSLIKILVTDSFISTHLESYNVTVAKYLRSNLRKVTRENQIEVEHVSEEEMKGYYRNPYTVKTNSIFEIMEIDKEVKTSVLTKINSKTLLKVQ
jgi:hypothetical protein